MDDIYRNLSKNKLWEVKDTPEPTCDALEITELWYDYASAKINTNKITLPTVDSLETNLGQPLHRGDDGAGETLVARFVWVVAALDDIGSNQYTNLSAPRRTLLLSRFGLDLAHDYLGTRAAGATSFPPETTSRGPRSAFSFTYAPKVAAIWSYTKRTSEVGRMSLTQGIFITQREQKSRGSARNILSLSAAGPWQLDVCHCVMFPAFVVALLLGAQIDATQESLRKRVKELEMGTRHHVFKSNAKIADGEKQELDVNELAKRSESASGYGSRLASTERKCKALERLLHFILHHSHANDDENPGGKLLDQHVRVLQERLETQRDEVGYTQKRVELQINALFNMIAQKDSLQNLRLSQSMSKISYFSYRDSSSMKTLAVVTMFFLPGSFVSSLFSTPLFDWDSRDLAKKDGNISVPSTPQFQLYWAVTVPLTVLTFLLYFLWLGFQKRQLDKKFPHNHNGAEEPESHEDKLARGSRSDDDIEKPGVQTIEKLRHATWSEEEKAKRISQSV